MVDFCCFYQLTETKITPWAVFLDFQFKQPIINLISLEEEIQSIKICAL